VKERSGTLKGINICEEVKALRKKREDVERSSMLDVTLKCIQ